MNLTKAIEGFLLSRSAAGCGEKTVKLLDRRLTLFANYLNNPEVTAINRADVVRFLAYLQNDYTPIRPASKPGPLKPSTMSNYHFALSGFFRWAEQEFGIVRPDNGIQRPAGKPEPVEPFTEDQIKGLLKAACFRDPAKRSTAIILTLLDSGLRVGELTRLEVSHANLATGELAVKRFSTGRKTAGRTVYLARTTRHAIWRYLANRGELQPDDALFASAKGGSLSTHAVYNLLSRIANRAGVQGMHPHRFRHTFAIQYLRNGGDVFTLQRLLGHTSLAMVQNYLALANSDSQEAHRKASPVDRWRL